VSPRISTIREPSRSQVYCAGQQAAPKLGFHRGAGTEGGSLGCPGNQRAPGDDRCQRYHRAAQRGQAGVAGERGRNGVSQQLSLGDDQPGGDGAQPGEHRDVDRGLPGVPQQPRVERLH